MLNIKSKLHALPCPLVQDGFSAMHRSCVTGNVNVIKYLVGKNASVNIEDSVSGLPQLGVMLLVVLLCELYGKIHWSWLTRAISGLPLPMLLLALAV
jgi:hypothetical protein